ncbi:MAG: hypothetical protein JRN08_10125 [Nitrososphaerota archaeon]|nr:hypothetical protein [Nitrososphaerota archaeon]
MRTSGFDGLRGVDPLTLYGIVAAGALMVLISAAMRRKFLFPAKTRVTDLLLVLLSPIVIGSWGTQSASDSTTVTAVIAQAQQSDYQAILWLGANTSGGASSQSPTTTISTPRSSSVARPTSSSSAPQPRPSDSRGPRTTHTSL